MDHAKKEHEKKPNRFYKLFIDFPHELDENGACKNLGEDGRCTIYEDRPLVCQIDGMWKALWSERMKKKEYYVLSAKACNEMIRENDYPEKYLVDESQYQ